MHASPHLPGEPVAPEEIPRYESRERRVLAGFGLAVGLILLISATSLLAIGRLRDDGDWVAHTHEVIGTLQSVMSLVTDAETASRGYAITGDGAYLQPYLEAARNIDLELDRLGKLLADDPEQSAAAAELSSLVAERMAQVKRLISTRNDRGLEAVRDAMDQGQGKRVQDAIRGQVAQMQEKERKLLATRTAGTERSTQTAIRSVALGGSMATAVAVIALFFTRRDYSGSRKAHAALREANARLDARVARRTAELQKADEGLQLAATVFLNTQESIVVTTPDCRIVATNPAFTKVTEYEAAEALGENVRILQSGRHDRWFYQRMWECIRETGGWQGEIWNRRKSGEIYQEWLAINAVKDDSGVVTHYIGMAADLSRMNRVETQLERLAHLDALTGLPNRLQLLSRLEHSLDRSRRHGTLSAVLFVDLDRFKAVNDTLGHAAGDQLLKLAAERMAGRLRDVDTLARLGGDEFVIVLEGIAASGDAAMVAEAIIGRLAAPFILGDRHEARIGASIGISLFPQDAANPAGLLEKADQALYLAKGAGRNTWRYSTDGTSWSS